MALVQRDAMAHGLLRKELLCLLVQRPEIEGLPRAFPQPQELGVQLPHRGHAALELLEASEALAEAAMGLQVRPVQAHDELRQLLVALGLPLCTDVPELLHVLLLRRLPQHFLQDGPQVLLLELAELRLVLNVGAGEHVLSKLLRGLRGALHGVQRALAGAVQVRAEARLRDAGHDGGACVHGQRGEPAVFAELLGSFAQHRPVPRGPLEAAAGIVPAQHDQGQADVLELFIVADGICGDAARGAGRQAAEIPHSSVQHQQPQPPPQC
mmetsp:Transcript_98025/g.272798  ORF Transcript_98025/g.272798 Transcript_98025/m.272798 type:complete len:268 (-) Transcript_98025:464-1267(-)